MHQPTEDDCCPVADLLFSRAGLITGAPSQNINIYINLLTLTFTAHTLIDLFFGITVNTELTTYLKKVVFDSWP